VSGRDLGTLGGANSSAISVNNKGEIVGWSETSEGARALWTPPREYGEAWTITDLGSLGGSTGAGYINERGEVVGAGRTVTGATHAFFWTARDGMTDITDVAGYAYCSPSGLNNRGHVIGRCEREPLAFDPTDFAFFWSAQTGLVHLNETGGAETYAYAINQSGEVTGGREALPEPWNHTMYWSLAAGPTDLGAPFGGYWSTGFDINDRGQIVGRSHSSTWEYAALWNPDGSVVNLGGLNADSWAFALDINNRGQVIGQATTYRDHDPAHAVLWTGDTFPFVPLVDLGAAWPAGVNEAGQVLFGDRIWTDECLFRPLDGTSPQASTVNDRGQVVGGSRTASGAYRATLWTVVPLTAQSWDAALRGKVKCLSRLGQLPKDRLQPLLAVIKTAAALSAQGAPQAACLELSSFVALLKQMTIAQELDPRQGGELVRDAVVAAKKICG
jgi:probable HAF family extracellular repeat protein